jgi:general secretion pathway protein A
MYEAFWKLNQRPFDDGARTDFYFGSPTHQAALLKLRYLIDQRKGIGLIVGEHGLGKTFLTHVIEREFHGRGVSFRRLNFPQLSPTGMLAYLAGRIGALVSSHDPDETILLALEQQLEQFHGQQHIVFMIDDAHLLDMAQLHVLRLLLNLREEGRADFTLVLAGRTELLARLSKLPALEQRMTVRTALAPLQKADIVPYLQHRLQVAGRSDTVFSPSAAAAVWELSQGIPRRINQLCDLALLVGYVDELPKIDVVEIEAAAEELMSIAA